MPYRIGLRSLTLAAALAAMLGPAASSTVQAQAGQAATLRGTVRDATGGVIAGAAVTVSGGPLSSATGPALSDDRGVFRLAGLAPGVYDVSTALTGFKTVVHSVQLRPGETLALAVTLAPGAGQEVIDSLHTAAPIDVQSAASPKRLSKEILEFVPFTSRLGPAAMLRAPGVNPSTYSAYGSGGGSGNAYTVDGVDVSDPQGGSVWLFTGHNWMEEVQVIGLGAPAQYGGFTGVASNTIFRSGSSRYRGLFESTYENSAMTDTNVSAEVAAQNPDLTPGTTDYVTDTTAQIGGPIRQNRMWFFASAQYYRPKTSPAGYPNPNVQSDGPQARLESSPRLLFKPTIRRSDTAQLSGFVAFDGYTVEGRRAAVNVLPEATLQLSAPNVSWNADYLKVLSPALMLDVKYAGFLGRYDLTPYHGADTPGWYDVATSEFSKNAYYYQDNDRSRQQVAATLTKYASGFAGEHNLKFGVELERTHAKSESGYSGDKWIYADSGVPYYAYFGNAYVQDNTNTRLGAFAQDAWAINRRLTLSPGVRVDAIRGRNVQLDDTVFSTNAIGPRIGVALDVFGNGRTAIRGHYGLYFDGPKTSYFRLVDPSRTPLRGAFINPVTLQPIGTLRVVQPGGSATVVDDGLKQPRMSQAIVGWEQHVWKSFAVSVTGIFRNYDGFLDDVLSNGLFTTRDIQDPGPDGLIGTSDDPSRTLRTYRQTNSPADNAFLITNPEDAYRDYRGVEIVANRRWSGRWMMQASWVLSKTTGNVDNVSSQGPTGDYDDPNVDPRFQVLRKGRPTLDNTHIGKVLGAFRAPWNTLVSGAFMFTSGDTLTRTVRTRLPQGNRTLFAEPRGSQRLDPQRPIDVKIEKQFRVSGDRRLGITFEGFNILNESTVTERTMRSGISYFTPLALVPPRRWRVGAVYRF